MKIYGQTLGEVFGKMPILYKMVVVVGSCFVVFSMSFLIYNFYTKTVKMSAPYFMEMENLPKNLYNMMDPSIAFSPNDKVMAMAFTAQSDTNISTRLVLTNHLCEKWEFKEQGIEGKPDTLIAPDGLSEFRKGSWRVETPSLVYDPDDKGKEWKLFAYKYFWSPNDPLNAAIKIAKYYGVITYKYSSNLYDGVWSEEKWLFSPTQGYPPKPYQTLVSFYLNSLSPDLTNITSYSRPSVVYLNGTLFMGLSAFTNNPYPDRMILLSSSDHGKTWKYLGSPTGKRDAQYIDDAKIFRGANLIKYEDKIYVAAVFGDENSDNGTTILSFENINSAKINRNPENNSPLVENRFERFARKNDMSNGGFITYADACDRPGIIVSEQNAETGQFKLIRTFEKPLD